MLSWLRHLLSVTLCQVNLPVPLETRSKNFRMKRADQRRVFSAYVVFVFFSWQAREKILLRSRAKLATCLVSQIILPGSPKPHGVKGNCRGLLREVWDPHGGGKGKPIVLARTRGARRIQDSLSTSPDTHRERLRIQTGTCKAAFTLGSA
eukprot:488393-Pelagomonas_calceolata.AAC.1